MSILKPLCEFVSARPSALQVTVIGLSRSGLNTALRLARHTRVLAFEPDVRRRERVVRYLEGLGRRPDNLEIAYCASELRECDMLVVAAEDADCRVPGPSSRSVRAAAEILKSGDVLLLKGGETAAARAAIERACIPILERLSGLKSGRDFTVAHSI